MDEPSAEPAADADAHASGETTASGEAGPTERKRRRWVLPSIIVPAVLLVVLIVGWAVDTSSAGVARNVRLGSADVGHLSEAEVQQKVATLAAAFANTPVTITAKPPVSAPAGTKTDVYRTTAAKLGLMVDQDATVANALHEGDDAFLLLRPFAWVGSFISHRDAPIAYVASGDQVATTVTALEGADRVPATEPTVSLVKGEFEVVPGKPGTGIVPDQVAHALPAAAAGHGSGPIDVTVTRGVVDPLGRDDAAKQAAAGLEALVKDPVQITTSGGTRTISSDTLRTWVTLSTAPDGTVSPAFDSARADPDLKAAFKDVAGGPVDAHFTVQDGKPVVVPEQAGKVCCGAGAAAKILSAIQAGTRTVALDLVDGAPAFTKAEADKLGIIEEVGQPTVFGPTTHHACCEPRVKNIHRIADTVRGQVILPGHTFSINETVGIRTVAKGYVDAPAIVDGEHGNQIGGGISQFGTTLFNASLYAGLDFGEYQSHSLWFDRYPHGHEATLSYPHPDLQVKNTTPYGILIWPEYTDTSLTVHLYSTHYVDVQVGEPSPSPAGACTKWTTPRTRTYLDGRVVHDSVFARYRPAEGVDC